MWDQMTADFSSFDVRALDPTGVYEAAIEDGDTELARVRVARAAFRYASGGSNAATRRLAVRGKDLATPHRDDGCIGVTKAP